MKDIIQSLEELCGACGVAGYPEASGKAMDLLRPLIDECRCDALGNVLAVRHGTAADAPVILLEAHIDEIGFLVTAVDDDGFLHVAPAGGVDVRVLAGQAVRVYGNQLYDGVFCSVPPHLAKEKDKPLELDEMGIDVGMDAAQARESISLGSRVSFAPVFCRLNDRVVSAKALDNRAGVAAILHCLRQLPPVKATVAVSFSVQEELGCRGAATAARQIQPDAAIVTDVSFAYAPGETPTQCGQLGGGAMIGISPVLDTAVTDTLQKLARKHATPVQMEVMGGATGTDADAVSKENAGIPTGLLSIPLRYMHTPVEMVDAADVAAVGNLMAAYIRERSEADG